MMKDINILLSTYNGQSFLTEQLQSIQTQNGIEFSLHVRDDGSSDETQSILRHWHTKGVIQRLTFGKHVGIVGSYFGLLSKADESVKYYAFSDQDDIWTANKIERAIKALSIFDDDLPALYCCRLRYVDSHGSFLAYSPIPNRGLSFQNALVENVAAGCTMVINNAARELILSNLPDKCVMHDWWCYIVVSAFGKVVYDAHPCIDYRLHHHNDVGAPVSLMGSIVRRIKRFHHEGRDAFKSHDQAKAFSDCFGYRLCDELKTELDAFVSSKRSIRKRFLYACHKKAYRQSAFDDYLLRFLICFNRY